MSVVDHLSPFVGSWHGTNLLRLMPTDDYTSSVATATVGRTAARFVSIAYTWFDGEAAQDGLLLVGGSADDAAAVWVDSWHTGPTWMSYAGGVDDDELRLKGTYPADEGPDWGWQIHVRPRDAVLTMHNIVPGHEPYQVVELALVAD
jgi:hypothetical protein